MVNQISVHVDQIKHNHNVILASFQNQATKDETETLMDEVKKTSHRIHDGLISEEGRSKREAQGEKERGGKRGRQGGREGGREKKGDNLTFIPICQN